VPVGRRFSLESAALTRQNATLEVDSSVRHQLPRLVLCILAIARTASAQIALPGGVALSPFPVLQNAAGYTTFDDTGGGIWAVYQGAQSGSGLYAQHLRSDGSYENDFTSAGRTYAKSGTLVNNFFAAPDGVGGAVVTWFGVNARDSTSQYLALRFAHILNDGSVTTPDSGNVVSTIASAAMVAGDGLGGAYVVWEENKGPSNPDIYAQHYDYWGHPLWTPLGSPTGIPVCTFVGIQRLRALVYDGSGGAYVVWADSRVGTTVPLYVARLLSDGVQGAAWPSGGVRVSPATTGIRIVGSALSPTGSLWLAWRDITALDQFNAQQVGPDGSFAWTSTGAIVATVSPLHADFVPGPSGNVFVTWGGTDVRCSRLNTTGVRVWSEPAGRVLVTPTNGTVVTLAAADGAGGQRVAWSTSVSGQDDIYSLHVDSTGAAVAGEPAGGDVVESGPATQDPVEWFDATNVSPIMVWIEDGGLRARRILGTTTGVEPPLEGGPVALATPAPNPWRGDGLTARFKAPPGEATLSLFDVTGRLVQEQQLSATGAEQAVSLRGLARLAAGVYTLRLETAGFTRSRRVVRVY
jgi:hypothetical protein